MNKVLTLKEAFLYVLYLVEDVNKAIEMLEDYRTSGDEYPDDNYMLKIVEQHKEWCCLPGVTWEERGFLDLNPEAPYYINTIVHKG